jgi:hypothetical protein
MRNDPFDPYDPAAVKAERQRVREQGQAALDWQKLYTWTESQPQGRVLGRSCTNAEDPLGAYLGAVTGTRPEVWGVGPAIITGYEDRLIKPDWVKRLITETDSETSHQSGPITREVYLKVLERVKPA